MQQVRHKRGSAVALVAALMLVLQSFLAGSTNIAVSATPTLDAFGNPLCITSVDHGDTSPTSDHSKVPDCCTLGCNHASLLLASLPGDGFGLLRPLSSAELRFRLPKTVHIQGPDHDPGSPRAPPLKV